MATDQQYAASDLVLALLRAAAAGKAQPGDQRAAVMAIQGLLPTTIVSHLHQQAERRVA